jgi:hypothetical protein
MTTHFQAQAHPNSAVGLLGGGLEELGGGAGVFFFNPIQYYLRKKQALRPRAPIAHAAVDGRGRACWSWSQESA